MLWNYARSAFRTLRRHKGFSAINILGLAVSMSVCLLILLLVQDQDRFDEFHDRADRIYRVTTDLRNPHLGTLSVATTPAPLAERLEAAYPGLEDAVRLRRMGGTLRHGQTTVEVEGFYAEPSFFMVFDFPLVAGDPATALVEPFSVVLTQEAASRLFGAADPLGRAVDRGDLGVFTVTGVAADVPRRSHMKFEALASFATLAAWQARGEQDHKLDDWKLATWYYTYVVLADGASAGGLEAGLRGLAASYDPGDPDEFGQTVAAFRPQALTEINLGRELSNELGEVMPALTIYVLGILALIIMLTACFNYVSLTLARALSRAREVGIRKVAGAHRVQLIQQFLSESVLLSLAALALGGVLLYALVPVFNELGFVRELNAEITLDPLRDGQTYLYAVAFSVGVGLLAGLYPAFYLSSFAPVHVLKRLSRVPGLSGLTLRKVLIVGQFGLSVLFITMPGVVYQQVAYMMQADYGFDREHLLGVDLQEVPYDVFRQQVLSHPSVVDVAAGSGMPVGSQTWHRLRTPAMTDDLLVGTYAVDEHYVPNLGLALVAGRNFSAAHATEADAVILSETAVRALGLGSPEAAVGQTLIHEANHERTVVGVVADYHFRPLYSEMRPLVLRYAPDDLRYALVRFYPDDLPGLMEHLQATWSRFDGAPPLRYVFFDDHLDAEYAFYADAIRIFGLAALFALVVACLGLLGMATYSMETRVKEVGVRKVLGAGVGRLLLLLSKDFVVLVGIALALALPAAYFLAQALLSQFAVRIALPWTVFAVSGGTVLLLALVTVGSKTVHAALLNPVETLRHE